MAQTGTWQSPAVSRQELDRRKAEEARQERLAAKREEQKAFNESKRILDKQALRQDRQRVRDSLRATANASKSKAEEEARKRQESATIFQGRQDLIEQERRRKKDQEDAEKDAVRRSLEATAHNMKSKEEAAAAEQLRERAKIDERKHFFANERERQKANDMAERDQVRRSLEATRQSMQAKAEEDARVREEREVRYRESQERFQQERALEAQTREAEKDKLARERRLRDNIAQRKAEAAAAAKEQQRTKIDERKALIEEQRKKAAAERSADRDRVAESLNATAQATRAKEQEKARQKAEAAVRAEERLVFQEKQREERRKQQEKEKAVMLGSSGIWASDYNDGSSAALAEENVAFLKRSASLNEAQKARLAAQGKEVLANGVRATLYTVSKKKTNVYSLTRFGPAVAPDPALDNHAHPYEQHSLLDNRMQGRLVITESGNLQFNSADAPQRGGMFGGSKKSAASFALDDITEVIKATATPKTKVLEVMQQSPNVPNETSLAVVFGNTPTARRSGEAPSMHLTITNEHSFEPVLYACKSYAPMIDEA